MTAVSDPIIAHLSRLAAVAVKHAAEVHGIAICDESSLAAIDDLLAQESGDAEMLGTLSTCYGAWFGDLLVRQLDGQWIALHEPFAPRIALGRAVVAPIDAVRRRLRAHAAADVAPTLMELFARASSWSQNIPARAQLLEQNTNGWNRLVRDVRFIADTVPADRAAAESLLDPWLQAEGIAGRKILCLAAGGGRHGPLFSRAGALVTVLDLSPAQLAIDARLSATHELGLTTLLGSIDDLPTLLPAMSFDVVVQPVSACYLRDLKPLHAGLAHVLRPGGLLVAQHKQPFALQAEVLSTDGWTISSMHVEGLPLPPVVGQSHREPATQEFLHTTDALLGGLCRAGFVIEDISEPPLGDAWATAGSPEHRAAFLPPYVKVKARRHTMCGPC